MNGVLGTGWRGGSAVGRAAPATSPFVTIGPGGDKGFTQATAHNGIHQLRRGPIVAFKGAREAVRSGIGAYGSIEQVGRWGPGVLGVIQVVLNVTGIGVEKDPRAIVFEAHGQQLGVGSHPAIGGVNGAITKHSAGYVGGVLREQGRVAPRPLTIEIAVAVDPPPVVDQNVHIRAVQVVGRGLQGVGSCPGTVAIVNGLQ